MYIWIHVPKSYDRFEIEPTVTTLCGSSQLGYTLLILPKLYPSGMYTFHKIWNVSIWSISFSSALSLLHLVYTLFIWPKLFPSGLYPSHPITSDMFDSFKVAIIYIWSVHFPSAPFPSGLVVSRTSALDSSLLLGTIPIWSEPFTSARILSHLLGTLHICS